MYEILNFNCEEGNAEQQILRVAQLARSLRDSKDQLLFQAEQNKALQLENEHLKKQKTQTQKEFEIKQAVLKTKISHLQKREDCYKLKPFCDQPNPQLQRRRTYARDVKLLQLGQDFEREKMLREGSEREVSALNIRLAQLQNSIKFQRREWSIKQIGLIESAQRLKLQLEPLRMKLKCMDQQRSRLQANKELHKNQLNAQRLKHLQLNKENQTLHDALQCKDSQLRQLKLRQLTQVSQLTQQLKRQKLSLKEVRSQLDRLTARLQSKDRQISDLKADIQAFQKNKDQNLRLIHEKIVPAQPSPLEQTHSTRTREKEEKYTQGLEELLMERLKSERRWKVLLQESLKSALSEKASLDEVIDKMR